MRLKDRIKNTIIILQVSVNRIWYPPLIGLLAAIDNLVVIIPTDGILISSTILVPKKWISFAIHVALGSTIGALILSLLAEDYGLPWILEHFPTVTNSIIWDWTKHFFELNGLGVIFIISLLPIMQHPAIIIAGLVNTPLQELGIIFFTGRIIKFSIMAYIASHAPKYLNKIWGLDSELKDVGIENKIS